jgi:hypothetical protein
MSEKKGGGGVIDQTFYLTKLFLYFQKSSLYALITTIGYKYLKKKHFIDEESYVNFLEIDFGETIISGSRGCIIQQA